MRISIDQVIHAINLHLGEEATLQVIDESKLHEGHVGHDPKVGISHIAVHIVTNSFEGLSRLERQRLVNGWLDNFFKSGLHSVRYDLKTQKESITL